MPFIGEGAAALPLTRSTGSDVLQDLNYTYDPVGNIVEMVDDAHSLTLPIDKPFGAGYWFSGSNPAFLREQTHYFSNTVIDPKSKYEYDALYRLLKATGREKDSLPMPGSGGYTPDFVNTDAQSSQTLRTYCQQFTYDALGNIQQLSHRATCGGTEHWKRNYQYNTNKPNNYLLSTYTGGTPPGTPEYSYDNHGNLLEMPHLSALNWDFSDQLKFSEKTDEITHYVYSGGERVRKVVLDTSGTPKIKYERIYLGGYELYREYDSSENLDLERETHHVMDDQRKITLLEVKTVDNGSTIANGSRTTIVRYQYTNHLDSACLELNESAEVLSYEEYHPFGTTSYSLHTNDSEVSLKRYKYVHKERDDESGLYYYGARYYAPWLCRFVSVDPLKDDYPYLTDYNYAGNKSVTHKDIEGLQGTGDEPVTHTVVEGDTYSELAITYGVSVDQLREWNTYEDTEIPIGVSLIVSGPTSGDSAGSEKKSNGQVKRSSHKTNQSYVGGLPLVLEEVAKTKPKPKPSPLRKFGRGLFRGLLAYAVIELFTSDRTTDTLEKLYEGAKEKGFTDEDFNERLANELETFDPGVSFTGEDDQEPDIVYRGGAWTATNFTPRPHADLEGPKRGLSTFRTPGQAVRFKPNQKYQIIDLNRIKKLGFKVVEDDDGHVSITTPTDIELHKWASTRGTDEIYFRTIFAMYSVIGSGKTPKR